MLSEKFDGSADRRCRFLRVCDSLQCDFRAVFIEGLNPALQAEMLCKEEEIPLSQYTMVTICLDNLQHIQHHDLQSQPFPRYG